jgi:ribulose-phosphate 3-epimerase
LRPPDLAVDRLVAPSILSADFARLGAQVDEVLAAAARVIHVDVMDGHFVPSISFGPVILAAIADRVHAAGAIVDAHLIIEQPERYVADIARTGADSITLHVEATPHLHYALSAIREAGCRACAAVSPGTRADSLAEVAHDALDLALCMSVDPGWGAQQFLPASLDKLQRMRSALPARVALEVDGGIHQESIASARAGRGQRGCHGLRRFASDDPAAAYAAIVAALEAG